MFNNHKHLIDISEYSDSELMTILTTAKAFSSSLRSVFPLIRSTSAALPPPR